MTLQELRERQAWSLDQKIDHAVGTIEAFLNHLKKEGKGAYISFSGGKDSTVLLDIARRFIDPNFPAVFCNTGNEWQQTVQFVKSFENVTTITPDRSLKQIFEKEGFPLVSKEQSKYIREARSTKSEKLLMQKLHGRKKGRFRGKISNKWKFLLYERFSVSEKCCYYLKKKPFAQYCRKTNTFPVLGIMAEESNMRQTAYINRGGCNTFDCKIPNSHHASVFIERDIWEYKSRFNLEFSPIYDYPQIKQTGCRACGFGAHEDGDFRFDLLYDLSPNFYNVFLGYTNNGVTYREALRKVGVLLPDEHKQYELF